METPYPTENPHSILREIRGLADPDLEGRHGRVLSVTGNIAHVEGMPEAGFMEEVLFSGGARGLVWQLLRRSVSVLLVSSAPRVEPGIAATATGSPLRVPVGRELLGRVVNHLGEPIDGGPPLASAAERGMGGSPPPMTRVRNPFQPIQTGDGGIDLVMPLARGSSQLIIGDRQSGKTTLARSTIMRQSERNETTIETEKTLCVYVAIGQRAADIHAFAHSLHAQGAMEYSVIVAASAAEPAGALVLAAATGEAIAGWFRDQGCHALLVLDDLSKYAVAYSEIALELRMTVIGRRHPPEIIHRIGQIMEGACQLDPEYGGGSLTILAVVETEFENHSEFLVRTLLGICDNHWTVRPVQTQTSTLTHVDFSACYAHRIRDRHQTAMRQISYFVEFGVNYSERWASREAARNLGFIEHDEDTIKRASTARAIASCLADPEFQALAIGEKAALIFSIQKMRWNIVRYDRFATTAEREMLLDQVFKLNPTLRDKVIRDHGLTNESAWCLEGLLRQACEANCPGGRDLPREIY